ncbi:TadE-like protein [Rhodoblastus acidophilus]|uniref:TadE-like protein n=1 Tax=Rhodoblastus acidophilus TaxID=1074 RepID=A0A212RBI1_RHOAC|nr:TadE/TadG family type IV pilus assembly protein [Rhodoblastus acidophilus]PPQ39391.1 hypothetical protein CKO16_06450 [Rhodoblastus acidophilus]RAI19411.1 hypothetical protein CH337_12120 [Rhodoblastus acidophilus]SNB69523.1 TadE-like protein [Rhodoblastus acidophilus]
MSAKKFVAFLRDGAAMATVEFALVSTVLILLTLGAYEVSNAISAKRHLNEAVYSVAQIISETPNPPGSLTYEDVQMAADSAMIVFPEALAASARKGASWSTEVGITISHVVMTAANAPCAANCQYVGAVAWTWGAHKRPCATPMTSAGSNAAPLTSTTVPDDSLSPGALTLVEASYAYQPTVFSGLFNSIAMKSVAALKPRNVPPSSYIKYVAVPGDTGATTICSGY